MASRNFRISTYLFTNIIGTVIRLLRLRVTRRAPVRVTNNMLIVANHRSYLDPLILGSLFFWPLMCQPRNFWVIPHFLAARNVVFRNRFCSWLARRLNCIPVNRDGRDVIAVLQILRVLRTGTAVIFPEGHMTRTGELQPGNQGVGYIIYKAGCRVIPVAIIDSEQVLPRSLRYFRFWRPITVVVGKPCDLAEELGKPYTDEIGKTITEKVMAEIKSLYYSV